MEKLLSNQYDNLDMFMEDIHGWDLDFKIIEPGGFIGNLTQLATDDLLVTYAKLGSAIHQEGAAPIGYRTFVILGSGCNGFWWLGEQVSDNHLLIFPTSNELQCVSEGDFEVYTISIQMKIYDEIVHNLGLTRINQNVVLLEKTVISYLRQLLDNVLTNNLVVYTHALKQELIHKLIIASTKQTEYLSPARSRDRALSRAVDYIRNIPSDHTPDMTELCRATSVSERTLQYAFKERYQISPATFVRAWKLNLARQLLINSNPAETRISSIATNFGFHHMGQFSAYYKQLFSELPTETLRQRFS
jgi:AraC family ethanolamine operon transcriptional activator